VAAANFDNKQISSGANKLYWLFRKYTKDTGNPIQFAIVRSRHEQPEKQAGR